MDKIDWTETSTDNLLAMAVTLIQYVRARNLELDYGRYLFEQLGKEFQDLDLLMEKSREHEKNNEETKVTK
jgi:hypothetical protein